MAPSPSDGTASSGVLTPMRLAVAATFSGADVDIAAKTELSERIVALAIDVQPE